MRALHLMIALALPPVLASATGMPAIAQPAGTMALVEDVSAGVAGVDAFDYVPAGKRIVLGASGSSPWATSLPASRRPSPAEP